MNNEQILEDAISEDEQLNHVTVDKRDLFDYVRSAIKEGLTTDENIDRQAELWSEAHDLTVKCLSKLYDQPELTKASQEMQSLKTIADIRDIFNLHKPMMTELPALIKHEITKARANQWIDCSVELPKDEKSVLVTYDGYVVKTCFYDGVFLMDSMRQAMAITHWQPLPIPPNAQQERN